MQRQEKETILVVDDSPANINILVHLLMSEYSLLVAPNGMKALEIAQSSQEVSLILLDVMMPEMDGYEVCRRLKKNPATQNIPVIFVTGQNDEAEEVKGLELGAADFVSKPFNRAILRARVKTQISLWTAMRLLAKENSVFAENIRLREDVERMSKHDLKGPLTAIINIPKMLVQDKSLTPDQIEILELLTQSALRMLEMINRSSDLYKMEQKTYQLNPVPVNLAKIVLQVFQELGVMAAEKKIVCSLLINKKPASGQARFEVVGEDFLFFSMLSNLVKNAIEASPGGAEVRVMLDFLPGESPSPSISVMNRGIIPVQIQGRLFQRYATYGKEGGTGLGVYSASLMANVLGGHLSFSTSESEGTTFLLKLPPPDTVATHVSPVPGGPSEKSLEFPGGKPKSETRILVADDYPFMRRVIMDILRQDGFSNFSEVGDGAAAIAFCEANPVDLVLSDWFMPKKSGLEVLEFMQNHDRLKHVPFIMITANLSLLEFENAAEKGLRNYITKPFSSDILRKKVEAVLSKSKGNVE